MSHPLVMAGAEVAALLGVGLATLPQKARRLRREANFPAPVPGVAQTWSRARVEAWLEDPDNAGRVKPARDAARLARQRDALEAKYAGGAA